MPWKWPKRYFSKYISKHFFKRIHNCKSNEYANICFILQGMKESIGAPIGVQVVALPFKEENVLRVMCELEQFSYKH